MSGLRHVTVPIFFFLHNSKQNEGSFGLKTEKYDFQARTKKYGFQDKTTFIFENSSKRNKIGTVTCLKPDNFHEVKKILRASLIFSTLGVVSRKEEM